MFDIGRLSFRPILATTTAFLCRNRIALSADCGTAVSALPSDSFQENTGHHYPACLMSSPSGDSPCRSRTLRSPAIFRKRKSPCRHSPYNSDRVCIRTFLALMPIANAPSYHSFRVLGLRGGRFCSIRKISSFCGLGGIQKQCSLSRSHKERANGLGYMEAEVPLDAPQSIARTSRQLDHKLVSFKFNHST